MKLLQNRKLPERQRAAAQLRFSEKVVLQKTLDAVRRYSAGCLVIMKQDWLNAYMF